jgi:hypothetical protein
MEGRGAAFGLSRGLSVMAALVAAIHAERWAKSSIP